MASSIAISDHDVILWQQLAASGLRPRRFGSGDRKPAYTKQDRACRHATTSAKFILAPITCQAARPITNVQSWSRDRPSAMFASACPLTKHPECGVLSWLRRLIFQAPQTDFGFVHCVSWRAESIAFEPGVTTIRAPDPTDQSYVAETSSRLYQKGERFMGFIATMSADRLARSFAETLPSLKYPTDG
jgi:hypothetical protein